MGFDSGGSVDLGSAHGTIGIGFDEQGIGAALDRIQTTVSSRLNAVGQNFQRIGGQMTVALAPITGFAAKGIMAYAEFDDILTEIEARTGSTAAEMESVRAKALQMGQDTAFSASDASQAMLELLSSGSDLNETMTMLPDVLNLAAAGNLALGTSADALTDIMAQFQLEADQSTRVVDALAAASQSSSATVGDLIQAFANVGPIAAGFGISVEEVAAALAVLAENGIKGSEAGTAFKSMLLNMTRDTDDVVQAWDTLGTSFVDAEGNMRALDDVIADINAGMDGMTEAERLSVINDLAGNYGQTALMALLASDGIDGMQESMANSTSASVLATAKMASFKGVINQVKSSMETLMINVMGPLVENHLKPMAESVTKLINKFNEWITANPELAGKIGLVVGVLAVLGPMLILVGKVIGVVSGAMAVLGAIIGSSLFLPIVALVAILGALYLAYQTNFMGIADVVNSAVNFLSAKFGLLIDFGKQLIDAYNTGGLSAAMALLGTTLSAGLENLVAQAKAKAPVLAAALVMWIQTDALPQMMAGLGVLWAAFSAWVVAQGPGIAMQLLTWATAFSQWVVAATPGLLLQLATMWIQFELWMAGKAIELVTMLAPWALAFVGWVAEAALILIPALVGLWLEFELWLAGKVLEIPGLMAEWIPAFVAWVEEAIPEIRAKLDLWLADVETWMGEQLPVLEDKAGELGRAIIDGLVNAIGDGADAVMGAIGDVVNGAVDFGKGILGIGSPSKVFMEMGGDVIAGLAMGLQNNQAVMDTMMGLAHGMQQPVLAGVGAGTPSTSINNASSVTNQIMVQMPAEALNMPPEQVRSLGNAFGEGIADKLQWELRKNL